MHSKQGRLLGSGIVVLWRDDTCLVRSMQASSSSLAFLTATELQSPWFLFHPHPLPQLLLAPAVVAALGHPVVVSVPVVVVVVVVVEEVPVEFFYSHTQSKQQIVS